jgi:GAF domain-containing protein
MTQQTDQIPTAETSAGDQTFLRRLRAWLRPPVFPGDEEKTRQAAMLNTILLAALVGGILYGLTLPWSVTASLAPQITFAAILVIMIGFGMDNLRRGTVRPIAYLVIIMGWLFAAVFTAIYGGVSSPLYPSFVVLIFAAGLLLGFRPAAVVGGLSIIYGVFLYFLESGGVLPALELASFDYLFRFIFIFLVASFLIYLTNQNFLRALRAADEARRESNQAIDELSALEGQLRSESEAISHELERWELYLGAAKQIAMGTTTSSTLEVMLDFVVDSIANQFGYYHVGIFLIDENKQWAVLRSASSEGGRQMITRDHRLGVGRQGIVGYVTSIGQPRITQDIGLDRIHSVTPELPETLSEMALPLEVHDQILGALDIQDKVPNAFSDDDVSALQLLADQIALAIYNFQLETDAKKRLEEVQRVYGEYSQRAWVETHRQKSLTAYRYLDGDLMQISDPQITIDADSKLEIPILVRGNKIGAIEIAKDEPQAEWTTEEQELLQTLSDQLGIALDSARLFNETQLRATTEQIIGDINADIWESLEINSILRTTVQKLQQSLDLPEVAIKMTPPSPAQPQSDNGSPTTPDESN